MDMNKVAGAAGARQSTESVVAELWAEVLQLPSTPHGEDDFFALGGDSLTMTMLEFRIMEEIDVELPAGTVLKAPTLGELSSRVDAALSAGRQ
jgi:acyl carrier protein